MSTAPLHSVSRFSALDTVANLTGSCSDIMASDIDIKVKDSLKGTRFEASELASLSGGSVNWTYVATLAQPLEDGTRQVMVKHGETHMMTKPDFALTLIRCVRAAYIPRGRKPGADRMAAPRVAMLQDPVWEPFCRRREALQPPPRHYSPDATIPRFRRETHKPDSRVPAQWSDLEGLHPQVL